MAHQVKALVTHIQCPEFGSPSQPGRRKQTSELVSHLHIHSVKCTPHKHIHITHAATITKSKQLLKSLCVSACMCVWYASMGTGVPHGTCGGQRSQVRPHLLQRLNLGCQAHRANILTCGTISPAPKVFLIYQDSFQKEHSKQQLMKEKTKKPDNQ